MPLPKDRSRSVKRIYRRTPSGRVSVLYKRATKARVKCRLCGAILGGVKDVRTAAKSERVPSRVFAGQLCSGCVARILKARTRIRSGATKISDYPFAHYEFIKSVKKK